MSLTSAEIEMLLRPYLLRELQDSQLEKLRLFLELLLKWNARTNLTSIQDPAEIVRRHFGESLYLAQHLESAHSVLDFGSGGGFPGIPIQIFNPAIAVTLAESQGKKSAFLRQAVRHLGLITEVWSQRVEALPSERIFDCVTMRAVDRSEAMLAIAERYLALEGSLALYCPEETTGFVHESLVTYKSLHLPAGKGVILLLRRPVFHVEQGVSASDSTK